MKIWGHYYHFTKMSKSSEITKNDGKLTFLQYVEKHFIER